MFTRQQAEELLDEALENRSELLRRLHRQGKLQQEGNRAIARYFLATQSL